MKPKKQPGQGVVEYALILVLIAIVVIGIATVATGGPRYRDNRCPEGQILIYNDGRYVCVTGTLPD
jgi:hypothetical protein